MDLNFELPEEQIEELTCAFKFFDKNDDQKLSIHELANVLRAVGQNPTDEDVRKIMESADENDDQFLNFEEYARLLKKHLKDPQSVRIELEQAFHRFDSDRTNTLDIHQLRRALMYCGQEPLTRAETDEFFKLMDTDGDNVINVTEFVDFMCCMDNPSKLQRKTNLQRHAYQQHC